MSEIINETINELNKPTQNNVFSIEDNPVTVLEKINQVERYLKQIDNSVDTSINTANEALEKANNAFEANGTLVKINGENQLTWSADFAESERQKSKNLFGILKTYSITRDNITITINSDTQKILINGTASSSGTIAFSSDEIAPISVKNGEYFTISKTPNVAITVGINNKENPSGSIIYVNNTEKAHTNTITQDYKANRLYFWYDAGDTFNNVEFGIQVEKGSVATDWQYPYGEIIHEKKLNEIVNGKYPIDINACTTYDQVYNLLQNATCGQCGIGVNHTNAIKSLLPTFPTNAFYVDCVANVIKNKYTASVSTYAIRFTGCPFGVNQPIYYCDVFYDGENTIVTGWYKPIAIKLIYDMSSSDSNINWGKSTGIKASGQVDGVLSFTSPIALNVNKKYRIYVNWGGDINIFTASVNHSGTTISGCSATWAYLLYANQLQMCEFQYLSNTNQIQLRFRNLTPGGASVEIQTSEYVYVTKIEEID